MQKSGNQSPRSAKQAGPGTSVTIANSDTGQSLVPCAVTSVSVQALSSLSPHEIRELVAWEEIIAKGWETFVNVGRALAQIRDKRLYRAEYDTFEGYCRHKWSYGKSHAYRLIGAATVIEYLSPIGDVPLPSNESQVRPLLGMKPELVQAVWREAVKKAGREHITATVVKQAADRVGHAKSRGHKRDKPQPTRERIARVLVVANQLLHRAKSLLDADDPIAAVHAIEDLKTHLKLFN